MEGEKCLYPGNDSPILRGTRNVHCWRILLLQASKNKSIFMTSDCDYPSFIAAGMEFKTEIMCSVSSCHINMVPASCAVGNNYYVKSEV